VSRVFVKGNGEVVQQFDEAGRRGFTAVSPPFGYVPVIPASVEREPRDKGV
jgi:hypothetical protein